MAHTRIWERENSSCYYEPTQLSGMIFAWEPNFVQLTTNEVKYALGIYNDKYFLPYGRFRRTAFSGTNEETSISLLKLDPIAEDIKFLSSDGYKVNVHFSFLNKLWNDGNYNRMLMIDAALIKTKINEFSQQYNRLPITKFRWPLAFTIDFNSCDKILNQFGIEISRLIDDSSNEENGKNDSL